MRPSRSALVLLALCLPAAAAAQPGDAELDAMRAASAPEWRPHIRSDTLVLESWVPPRGGDEVVAWTRARYTTPRSFGGEAYDTRYTRYVGDCERRQTRFTRMVWALGATVTNDTAITRGPADARPGTVSAAMLDVACATRQLRYRGGEPAQDVAMLMVLPTSRWVALGRSEAGRAQHVDLEGAVAEGGNRLVWLRVLLDEAQRVSLGTFDSMYQRWALDCAGGRVQMRRLVLAYDDRVIADSVVRLDWVQPRAATATHSVLDRLCGGGRAAAPAPPPSAPYASAPIAAPVHAGLTEAQQRTIAEARALLASRMAAAGDPNRRADAFRSFDAALGDGLPPAVLHDEVAFQMRALFERDFRTGFDALMAARASLDVRRLMAEAVPQRYQGCVRARAVWIGDRHRAQQAGTAPPREPVCAVR